MYMCICACHVHVHAHVLAHVLLSRLRRLLHAEVYCRGGPLPLHLRRACGLEVRVRCCVRTPGLPM